MKFSLALFMSVFILSACHSNTESKQGGGTLKEVTFATYEMIEGCSTGVKKINAASRSELDIAFCNALKNSESNGNCAQNQREQVFKAYKCSGTWPHAPVTGLNVSSSQTYSHSSNTCTTGIHYVSSSNTELGKRAYCSLLLDDELNLNCARVEREEKYLEAKCKLE